MRLTACFTRAASDADVGIHCAEDAYRGIHLAEVGIIPDQVRKALDGQPRQVTVGDSHHTVTADGPCTCDQRPHEVVHTEAVVFAHHLPGHATL